MASSPAQPARLRALRRGWRNLRRAGWRRLVIAASLLVLALVFARFSWSIPVAGDAERALHDWREYIFAPRIDQDPRIQDIVYTDRTLIDARKRSPLDRGLLARALPSLDAMGAKAIGIDVLFDQPQNEDDALIAALRAMKTPTFVAYADVAGNKSDITFEQQQYLDGFMARLKGSNARPASIQLDYARGVTREWPRPAPRAPQTLVRGMLAAAGDPDAARFGDYSGTIRYRLPRASDRPVFSELQIDLLANPAIAPALADQIRGRYVLIGGDIVDVDRVTTPFTAITGDEVPGIEVHAAMLAQALDGAVRTQLGGATLWAVGLLVVAAASLTSLLEWSLWRVLPFVSAQALLFGGLPFWFEWRGVDTTGTPAVGWALGWITAFTAVAGAARAAGAEQRRFAQGALGKYLPRDIAQAIIDNPELLALHGRKEALYIVFSDLEGFTKLSHQLPPETVARLLNEYLEALSQVVLDHGGVIDKFVGDAVVAFWGAPIARPDDGAKAARAGYAMWRAGEDFRARAGPGIPPIGKTRVGMHYGEAVVGNFGGERRIQYTALGDAMNTAARLESANKELGSSVLASREFVERSGLDWWRPLGRVVLRGRAQPVEIFEAAPDFPEAARADLASALARAGAKRIAALATIAKTFPQDNAILNLLSRIRDLGENDASILT